MSLSLDRQIRDVKDKDDMHRLIDELDEKSIAILCVRTGTHDDGRYTATPYGDSTYVQILGLLEATKLHIFQSHMEYEDGG